MNHLAHLLLARLGGASMPGVLMGDFVKGALGTRFDEELARGIVLHRTTDSFTDAHPRVGASRRLFTRPTRRYAGIVLDICYDHFLLKHWHRYAGDGSIVFTRRAYAVLEQARERMPPELRRALPGMISRDWLRSCETLDGVSGTLAHVFSRLSRSIPAAAAMDDVRDLYPRLEQEFLEFFPDVIDYTLQQCQAPVDQDPLAAAAPARESGPPAPGRRGDSEPPVERWASDAKTMSTA